MSLLDSSSEIGRKKWIAAAWTILECFFFGGLMFGWGTVSYVLKMEGIYSELCLPRKDEMNDSTKLQGLDELNISIKVSTEIFTTCDEQDKKISLCFTIATALSAIFNSVLGYLNLKYGTRITRVVIFIILVLGFFLMAFTSTKTPWLIFPGWSFVGIGGFALMANNLQVSNLFTTRGPLLVGFISGSFDSSSAFLLLLKVGVEHGFTRQNWFFIMTAMLSTVLFSTFFVMPVHHVRRPDENIVVEINDLSDNVAVAEVEIPEPEVTSPWKCLIQRMFLTHLVWMSFIQLQFWFYIGSINYHINAFFHEDEYSVSKYTNTFSYFLFGGFATTVLSGVVYGWQLKKYQEHELEMYRKVMPAVIPLLITSLLSVCLSVLVLVQSKYLLYLSFGTVVLMRSFLYNSMATFLYTVFPANFSMFLYGVTMLVAGGVFGSLQYALFEWTVATENGNFHVNITLLILALTSCVHPLYLWLKCRRQPQM